LKGFTATCDDCGRERAVVADDVEGAQTALRSAGWVTLGDGKHRCPVCVASGEPSGPPAVGGPEGGGLSGQDNPPGG